MKATLKPKQFTLQRILTFETFARHSSMTRAAQELSITVPSVSESVRCFEQLVGFKLIEKQGRDVALTDAAVELFIWIAPLAQKLREFPEAVEQIKQKIEKEKQRRFEIQQNYADARIQLEKSQEIKHLPTGMKK